MVPSSLSPLATGPIETFAMVHLRLILPVRNVLEAHQRVWPLTSWSVTWSVSDSRAVSLFRFDAWKKKGVMVSWLTQLILFWTQMQTNSKVTYSSIVKCWTSTQYTWDTRPENCCFCRTLARPWAVQWAPGSSRWSGLHQKSCEGMRKETASICQAVTQPTMLTIPILLACKMPVKNT